MRERYKLQINTYDEYWENNKLKASAIEFCKLDSMWMFKKDGWHIDLKDLHEVGIPAFDDSAIDLQDKKIYRFPKITLPRQKVDLLKEKYNCKVIRDASKADISIVSMKLFDSIIEREWTSSIAFQDVFQILVHMKEIDMLSDGALVKLQEFLGTAPTTAQINFKINKHWNSQTAFITKTVNDLEQWIRDEHLDNDGNGHDWYLSEKNYVAFNNLKDNTSQIVLDTQISNIIDSELAVIDNTEYKNMYDMITSSDIDNRSLALELLANCNIEKSFDVVSELYYWNYDWIKATTNWNSVNVKTMRNRLKAYEGGHGTSGIHSFNNYLTLLAKDRKLTTYAVNKTREKLLNTLMGNIVGPEASVFKVDLENLYIADEIKSKIEDLKESIEEEIKSKIND